MQHGPGEIAGSLATSGPGRNGQTGILRVVAPFAVPVARVARHVEP